MNLIFNTYEKLSDFCYPFDRFFYRQKLDNNLFLTQEIHIIKAESFESAY